MRLASQSAILVKVWTWNASRNAWKASGGIFDIPQKETRLKELERRLEDPSLWNDPEAARKVSQEAARLRRTEGRCPRGYNPGEKGELHARP